MSPTTDHVTPGPPVTDEMTTIDMPHLADTRQAMLVQWQVAPGDRVHRTQTVAYIETSKGVVPVECFENGTIEELLVEPGDVAPAGAPLARLRRTPSGAS